MTASIHTIRDGQPPPAERLPNESVITILRRALASAEAGDIQAVAVVEVDRDGCGMRYFHAAAMDRARLGGHIGRLFHEFMAQWAEQ